MAFNRESRLNKSSMISLVSRKGASWKSPFFRIKFLPARFGSTKIAIITSKKVDKTAVGRNKIRRKISSCFQEVSLWNAHNTHNKTRKKSFLMIVFPTKEVLLNHDYEVLKDAVHNSFKTIENFVFQKKKFQKKFQNP